MTDQHLTDAPIVTAENISQDEIEKVIDIIRRATTAVLPPLPSGLKGNWLRLEEFTNKHERKPIWLALTFILISLALYFLQLYIGRQAMLLAGAMASSLELAAIGILVCDMILIIPTMTILRSEPFHFVLNLLELGAIFELKFIHELDKCSPQSVQYVTKQYQYQRIAMEKRGAALSGSIDKLGLFPAIAALALLWHNLSQSGIGPWSLVLAIVILAFHLLNLYSFGLQQRMDRVIAILDASIATRSK